MGVVQVGFKADDPTRDASDWARVCHVMVSPTSGQVQTNTHFVSGFQVVLTLLLWHRHPLQQYSQSIRVQSVPTNLLSAVLPVTSSTSPAHSLMPRDMAFNAFVSFTGDVED